MWRASRCDGFVTVSAGDFSMSALFPACCDGCPVGDPWRLRKCPDCLETSLTSAITIRSLSGAVVTVWLPSGDFLILSLLFIIINRSSSERRTLSSLPLIYLTICCDRPVEIGFMLEVIIYYYHYLFCSDCQKICPWQDPGS